MTTDEKTPFMSYPDIVKTVPSVKDAVAAANAASLVPRKGRQTLQQRPSTGLRGEETDEARLRLDALASV